MEEHWYVCTWIRIKLTVPIMGTRPNKAKRGKGRGKHETREVKKA